ncbi:inositol monophosphatase family protein [Pseudonocardia sp. HH130630-07]|uniref:inositol monophosphatase family protein n=1 Tax=Pseudonocardia sp. HH130630-07 TaxID=1690815 RepID=UPI000814FED7|nr:inositol monophosphatase family protein [Pseudonocardia sp. HH130630-07]ANY07298.1 myo-inositol-1-monophosphatase [Pseudonocardia sp. HH130630-07]
MTAVPYVPRQVRPVDPALLSRALETAGRLANDAAEVITATLGREHGAAIDATAKTNPFDWVTDTDRTLERHTRRVLAAEFPDCPVVGEEYGADHGAADAPMRWVVDPVDGTANYVAGLPWCAYSLALVAVDGPAVGVVADPGRGQIYAAARGRGFRANGTPVPPARPARLAGSLVCAEDPEPGFVERARAGHAGVRVLGSAALAITQVALGHAVAAVLTRYHEWDVAGALCLATEAGALVLGRDGHEAALPAGGMLVVAPQVAAEVCALWRGQDG